MRWQQLRLEILFYIISSFKSIKVKNSFFSANYDFLVYWLIRLFSSTSGWLTTLESHSFLRPLPHFWIYFDIVALIDVILIKRFIFIIRIVSQVSFKYTLRRSKALIIHHLLSRTFFIFAGIVIIFLHVSTLLTLLSSLRLLRNLWSNWNRVFFFNSVTFKFVSQLWFILILFLLSRLQFDQRFSISHLRTVKRVIFLIIIYVLLAIQILIKS